ncbi:helix-turn-helix transcriptional regulator [Leclercia adecarboxylata]|uniref:helix-turn-helix transcriptional regulator n=1 Tax=Leclercia adecarboxylata TaxID=83655 RepID=UPI00124CD5CD|nr:AlpA family transcriptional regulator [Leclercia adecarboxylata]QFH50599.1 AlpA family transcriptional regulator [Leclercia adecarboxylata]
MTAKKEKLIRMHEVLKRTGFCRAWIYQHIHQKRFPEPVKIGERAIAFIESEIDEWIESVINMSRKHVA